jgi:hypothetical protein
MDHQNIVVIVVILRIISGVIAIGVGGYLAMIGKAGWGWFLFVGLILACINISEKPTEKPENKVKVVQV